MNQNNIKPQELLTGKALKSFKAYIKKENGWTSKDFTEHYKCQGNNKYTCADIVDWLDSVGAVIDLKLVNVHIKTFEVEIVFTHLDIPSVNLGIYKTRHQATQEAIKKVVYLYNERSKE